MASCFVNKPEELILEGDIVGNIRRFKDEFEIYLEATELSKKKKNVQKAVFLNLVGKEARRVYNTIDNPPETYQEILGEFHRICAPRKNLVMCQYKFFQRKQQEGENFKTFLLALKELVVDCNFLEAEDDIVRTQIVLGINNRNLKERLLRADFCLEKTIQVCQASETAEEDMKELERNELSSVFMTSTSRTSSNTEGYKKKQLDNENQRCPYRKLKCTRCNYTHANRECPARGQQCNKCGKVGHFAACCRTPKVNSLESSDETSLDKGLVEMNHLTICTINGKKAGPDKWDKDIELGGKVVQFKLDTRADVNTLPLKIYNLNIKKELFRHSNIVVEGMAGLKSDLLV